MKSGILSLGTRSDARTWEQQCLAQGIETPLPVKTSSPTLAQIKDFFRRPADWLYFGGHFIRPELYNEAHNVGIKFYADRVEVEVRGEQAVLRKGSDDFRLDQGLSLILWAGCSTLSSRAFIAELNQLFGAHLMLGFRRMTGIAMCNAMFTGGGFIRRPFFDRVAADKTSATTARDAWMGAALEGYGGSENEDRFAAVDPDGTLWTLQSKAIKKGAKMF